MFSLICNRHLYILYITQYALRNTQILTCIHYFYTTNQIIMTNIKDKISNIYRCFYFIPIRNKENIIIKIIVYCFNLSCHFLSVFQAPTTFKPFETPISIIKTNEYFLLILNHNLNLSPFPCSIFSNLLICDKKLLTILSLMGLSPSLL